MPETGNVQRKARTHWMVRKIKRINVSKICANVLRYGALPATIFYITNYTEPEPDLISLFNPFW